MNAAATHATVASALLAVGPPSFAARGGDNAARRLAIHRNNHVLAMLDALAATFPITRALVGEAFFATLARGYLHAEPPRSPIIALYGERFAGFIAACATAAELPWLADVARLEWLRVRAFHAADAEAVDPSALARLGDDPERLAATRVRLHPACRWLSSQHPVLGLWKAHQQPDAARDAALAALDLDVAEDVLLYRPRHEVRLLPMPAGGVDWLQALAEGAAFGPALQHACDRQPDARPQPLFALLVHHGLVVALSTPEDPLHE